MSTIHLKVKIFSKPQIRSYIVRTRFVHHPPEDQNNFQAQIRSNIVSTWHVPTFGCNSSRHQPATACNCNPFWNSCLTRSTLFNTLAGATKTCRIHLDRRLPATSHLGWRQWWRCLIHVPPGQLHQHQHHWHHLHYSLCHPIVQGVFFLHWYPPKKLKYGKPRLGESTLT